ncbi:MAG: ABC-F family ATP-binding cassette domain-containing protein, partial [Chitinophagaceae bacterium]|nr:ABC-F family ATP-binding cassette domain-containing protein [Chitinophagaceae bacterium]
PDIRINFQVDKMPGKVLVELSDITKKFGDNTIVENAKAEIDRGDKIALIGANGKGKSTLLRIIAGIEPFEGNRRWGHNVEESFYAQHQLESLGLGNTVLEEMKTAGAQKTELELRTLLGCFLFSGDDADKKIKVLSGGEKARVALAKTIVSKANFLMLDEPTNHLDMHSVDLLIDSLNRYEGTIILVSHDRYFISKVANKIWEIDEHQIKVFDGGYEEWVEWKERMARNAAAAAKPQDKKEKKAEPAPAPKPEPVAAKPVPNAPINKEVKKELQKQQRILSELEQKIDGLNKQKAEKEALMAAPETYADKNKFMETESSLKTINASLKDLNAQYETVFEKVMELEEQANK